MRAQSVVRRRLKALLLVLVTAFLLSMIAQAARQPVHRSAAGELSIKRHPFHSTPTPAYNASLASGDGFSNAAAALHPCVLIRTYSGNRNDLVSLLWSLLLSGHPNLRAFVVDTGKVLTPGLPDILHSVNALSGRDWVEMSPRTLARDVKPHFPGLDGVEDYGYALTDLVMEDIMNGTTGKREAGSGTANPGDDSFSPLCDTLTITNGDNVYSPAFLKHTLGPIADMGMDMAGTNWVSRYEAWNQWPSGPPAYADDWCGPHRSGKTQEMKISPAFTCGCVDLGAVTFRLENVHRSGVRFIVDKLRADEKLGILQLSDCNFFQRLKASGAKTSVVHEALFIHN